MRRAQTLQITWRLSPALAALPVCAALPGDLAAAVEPPSGAAQVVEASAPSLEERFRRLEERLLADSWLGIRFDIEAEGVFAADLEGYLELDGPRDRPVDRPLAASLRSWGQFGDERVKPWLTAQDGKLAGGALDERNDERAFEGPTPAALRESIVLGLTRMGLLHNLARLTAGAAPDRADGGVAEWVQVKAFREDCPEAQRPSEPRFESVKPVCFDIIVAGSRAGSAAVWIDAQSGLLLKRVQTVRFPQGEMRVVERYTPFLKSAND